MSEQSDAYAACLCGHVRAHHAVVSTLTGARSPYCEWRGCGCPRFVVPGQSRVRITEERAGGKTVVRVCGCADHPCTCMRSGGSVVASTEAQR